MKYYTYEIRYNSNGEQTSEFEYTKLSAVKKYIEILTMPNTFDNKISALAIFRNGVDITPTINKFLLK